MPMYTKAEQKVIDAAWYKLLHFVEHRSMSGGHDLEALAKEERRTSYSPTLGHWSPAECRLYVLRQVRDGIRNADRPVKPSDLCGHRSTLLVAWFLGADLYQRPHERAAAELEEICTAADAAAATHDKALERFLHRSRV
jgi:hypothetical protein